jgi:Domain of unknown function (DUF4253)
MDTPLVHRAGSAFRRIGGREGSWRLAGNRLHPARQMDLDPDDHVMCPFDFVEVAGKDAEATIGILRKAHPTKIPILFGSPHEAGIMLERGDLTGSWRGKSTAGWLRDAETFDLDGWFAERATYWRQHETEGRVIPSRGPWPRKSKTYNRMTVGDEVLWDEPKPKVIIGLLPTRDPTETAAYLGFGGWNDCPSPPVHIQLARRWHERYGAVQVSNTYEQVEFQVAKPLTDRAEALRLALDQFYWCSDSVPETLQSAAAELIGSTVWVFWWD